MDWIYSLSFKSSLPLLGCWFWFFAKAVHKIWDLLEIFYPNWISQNFEEIQSACVLTILVAHVAYRQMPVVHQECLFLPASFYLPHLHPVQCNEKTWRFARITCWFDELSPWFESGFLSFWRLAVENSAYKIVLVKRNKIYGVSCASSFLCE